MAFIMGGGGVVQQIVSDYVERRPQGLIAVLKVWDLVDLFDRSGYCIIEGVGFS